MTNHSKFLASTPPMGWNSWNMFGPRVSADAVCGMADAMVSTGLKDCGYEYIVVDDCWSVKDHRDPHGDLIPDPERFADGVKPVADYVHSLGLKFGIYSDAAEMTCANFPGSFGFEDQDAALWASWGVDFLKYDYCHAPGDQATAIERYTRMGQALRNSGREILFSICEWGGRKPHLWARQAGGQMWRATGDVVDSWVSVLHGDWWGLGLDPAIDLAVNTYEYAGPGGWNDMDMLIVGLGGKGSIPGSGCSFHEYQTQVSMWSMLCSPLMIGCDLRTMTSETASLLTNREVLAVNQDALGEQARRIKKEGSLEIWKKRLADGGLALALLNRGSTGQEIDFTAGEVSLLDEPTGVIRDLWKQQDIADFDRTYQHTVQPHATVLLKISAG
ncbi:MAG TPA: glycoside hydrolase family 27 protein [Anaerolineaceae bacterium]